MRLRDAVSSREQSERRPAGQKVCVDERERGQCPARERDLCFLFKIRGVAASFFKKMRREEGYGFFAREDRFRFFFVFSLFSEKLPPCQYFSPPHYYGWRFIYIENLYTCYSRKYYNNYCRDCFL
jgi:hypothetical protein